MAIIAAATEGTTICFFAAVAWVQTHLYVFPRLTRRMRNLCR